MFHRLVRKIRRNARAIAHPTFSRIALYLLQQKVSGSTQARENSLIACSVPDWEFVPPTMSEQSGRIPAIVFQTWKSRSEVPSNYRYWRNSFKRLNPDFNVLLWDDADNLEFIESNFTWFLPMYDAYPKEIFRADAVRPFFLFLYGGIYADMDAECLVPLRDTLGRGAVVLGRMGWDNSFEHSIPNAIMASRPFQGFWLLVISMMIERLREGHSKEQILRRGPEYFTGPIVLKCAADFYRSAGREAILARTLFVRSSLSEQISNQIDFGELTVLPPDEWYGVDWTNPIHQRLRQHLLATQTTLDNSTARRLFPTATMITYWSHSW